MNLKMTFFTILSVLILQKTVCKIKISRPDFMSSFMNHKSVKSDDQTLISMRGTNKAGYMKTGRSDTVTGSE